MAVAGGDASAEAELTEAEAARKRPRAPAPSRLLRPSGCAEPCTPVPHPHPIPHLHLHPLHPAWVEYQSYAAGAIVRYKYGQLYIAKFANPGYNPTISTYARRPRYDYPAWV